MKDKFIEAALHTAATVMFKPTVWGQLQALVRIVDDEQLTGEEKKRLAIKKAKELGITFMSFFLSMGIDMAVAALRLKAGISTTETQ